MLRFQIGRLVIAITLAPFVACVACSGGSSDAGQSARGADIPVVEVALNKDDGVARPLAWAVDPIPNLLCWHPSQDDAVFTVSLLDKSTVQKVSQQALSAPLFSATKIFGADSYYVECPTVVDAPNGGAYVVGWLERAAPGGTAAVGIGIARLASDGSSQWTKIIGDGGKNGNGVSGVARLVSGTLAVSFKATPLPGSLDQESWVVGFYDDMGNELGRTNIPDIHLPKYDHPGVGIGQRTPGTAFAHVRTLSALADGGLLVAGTWDFLRNVECGSYADPIDPVTTACADGASNALVARIDASRKLLWASRVGSGYDTSPIVLTSAAAADDGSVLATGTRDVEPYPVPDGHLMGIALHVGNDGSLDWVKSYPWGPAPGARFSEGGTAIDAVVATPSGGFDAMFHPSSESNCRVVHFAANGALSRVQEVKHPVGAATGYAGPCRASSLDGALTFSILSSFSRIARDPR